MGRSGRVTVLIAAGAGFLREALVALMFALPDVTILEADNAVEAEGLLRVHRPDFVMIDCALPGNHTMQLIYCIQENRPRARCLILVDNILQQALALRAGADRAPLKGEPAARLFAQVEELLRPAIPHRTIA